MKWRDIYFLLSIVAYAAFGYDVFFKSAYNPIMDSIYILFGMAFMQKYVYEELKEEVLSIKKKILNLEGEVIELKRRFIQ